MFAWVFKIRSVVGGYLPPDVIQSLASETRLGSMRSLRMPLLAGLLVSCSAFSATQVPSSVMRARRSLVEGAIAAAPAAAPAARRPARRTHRSFSRLAPVQMGLFGLGAPEIAVIALVGLFIVGPDKLGALAKDLGKATPGLKEVASEAVDDFKEVAAGAVDELKESSAPALAEFKDAVAAPALAGLKDVSAVALKEVKEVVVAVAEGAAQAEVPSGTADASTGTGNKAVEAVKAQE